MIEISLYQCIKEMETLQFIGGDLRIFFFLWRIVVNFFYLVAIIIVFNSSS